VNQAAWSMKQVALLAACFMVVSCLAYCSILMMDVIRSSETLVEFYGTSLLYIREDKNLDTHSCDNLKSSNILKALHNLLTPFSRLLDHGALFPSLNNHRETPNTT
jgi:hypothetical protein